jgi:hypothetical protein
MFGLMENLLPIPALDIAGAQITCVPPNTPFKACFS